MKGKPIIDIFSFGFKYYTDTPPACDLRIDLRNKMKNPQSHLPKGAIGKDKIVINTVLDSAQNKKYIETLKIFKCFILNKTLEWNIETRSN